jgi:hypothetical protein
VTLTEGWRTRYAFRSRLLGSSRLSMPGERSIEGIEHKVRDLLGFGAEIDSAYRQNAHVVRQVFGDRA